MQCYKVFLAAAMVMATHSSVLATSVSDDYQVELQVQDRTQEVLQAALPQALEQVLVKISGDPQVTSIASVHDHLAEAQHYVERYEYLPDPEDATHQKLILQIKFSSKSVRELLHKTSSTQEAASPETISLHVYGVNDLNDFSEVVKYVRALNSVNNVEASTVDADDVILTVKSSAGLESLKKAIANTSDHRLQPMEVNKKSDDTEPELLTYRWKKNLKLRVTRREASGSGLLSLDTP